MMPRTLTIAVLTVLCAACALAQVAEPIASGPPPVEELAAEAERLYDEWRWDEMKAIALRMVTHYPEDARSWYWRGKAQNHEEQNAQAREAYERALQIDPDLLHAHRDLVGVIWATDGRAAHLEAARELADRCGEILVREPDSRDAHWARAWALHWLDDPAGAREELRRVLEADAEDAEALRDLARFTQDTGDVEAAARLYERAVATNPDDMEALMGLAHLRSAGQQRHQDALAVAERMKRVNPMEPEAYHLAGRTLGLFLDDLDASMAQFDIALALEPEASQLWASKANVLRIAGSPAEALAVLDTAVEEGIDATHLHMARGNCYRELGRAQDAVAEYAAAIEQRPNNRLAYWLRARVQIELGNYDEAWADVHRAEDLGDDVFNLRQELLQHMPEPEGEGEG